MTVSTALRSRLRRVALSAGTGLVIALAIPALAQANTTKVTLPVPAEPGIYNVAFEFRAGTSSAPLLSARRSHLTSLPADTTVISGVRRDRSGGRRWRGIATVIRYQTPIDPAAGRGSITLRSNTPFRIRVRGAATTTAQSNQRTLGGRWKTRVGRLVQDSWVREQMPFSPAQLLREAGNILGGAGNPQFLLDVTGQMPQNQYRVHVSPVGRGTGEIFDGTGIRCGWNGAAVSGTCDQWYYAGTPLLLNAQPAIGSMFEAWTGECAGVASTSPCDLGRPQGGRTILLGGMFV